MGGNGKAASPAVLVGSLFSDTGGVVGAVRAGGGTVVERVGGPSPSAGGGEEGGGPNRAGGCRPGDMAGSGSAGSASTPPSESGEVIGVTVPKLLAEHGVSRLRRETGGDTGEKERSFVGRGMARGVAKRVLL